MVNQSQLETVRELVRTSKNLSDAERTEWLGLLGFMNDKQLSDLSAILQSASPTPEPPKVIIPVKVIAPEQIAAPAAELDLPAPTPTSRPAIPPIATPPPGANTVSAFINRNFATELHRTPVPPSIPEESAKKNISTTPVPAPPELIVPTPPARSVNMSDIAAKAPAAPAAEPLAAPSVNIPPKPIAATLAPEPAAISLPQRAPEIVTPPTPEPSEENDALPQVDEEVVAPPKNLEDVRRLNVATLRGRGVLGIETELKTLCQKFGYFSVQFALEHSPLYQTYLAVGSRVLQQHQSFEGVQAELAAGNRPYLTKPEFEEINDLLQRIKSG